MEVTEASLKERYASLDTDALLRLRRAGDLTPLAQSVIEQTLRQRGVDASAWEPANEPYAQPKANLVVSSRLSSTVALYRGLLCVNTLLFLIWFFVVPAMEDRLLSADILELLGLAGYGSRLSVELAYWLNYLLAFAWVAVYVGLFFFFAWARPALVWLFLLNTALGLFMGLGVHTGPSTAIGGIITAADGAVIAMSYLTTVAREFRPVAAKPPTVSD